MKKLESLHRTARRTASLLCALALTVSVCAAAGTGRQTVRAKLWDGYPMYVDEIPIAVADENNLWRYPLLANGTFYIPLQTASEFLGADFTWDGKTAALTVTGDPVYRHHYRDQPESTDEEDQILLQERDEGALLTFCPDVVVTLDGKPVTFTTVSGAPSYPGICRDVLYLPLRGVAELCGKEITYLPPSRATPGRLEALSPISLCSPSRSSSATPGRSCSCTTPPLRHSLTRPRPISIRPFSSCMTGR